MTVKIEEVEKPVESIKRRCVKCLKGTNLLKTAVILVCTGVVVQQITTCIWKLIDVPITTYTHFDFNKTLIYPSVTFCREPPYKHDNLLEHGLYSHPRYTSSWFGFNFSAVTLDQLWDEITYDETDFFAQYGLNGETENVEVKSTLGFVFGRCITLEPKILHTTASRATGYSITLQHSAEDMITSTSIYPPGYHIFVHYSREPFTEVEVYNGGLVDYLYINTGETMDVKLTVDEYFMISQVDDPCSSEPGYNSNDCTSKYVWDQVGEQAGCSGPWMTTSNLPRCDNYTTMRSLIATYMNTYNNHHCVTCPRSCRSFLYNAFVTDRQILYTWDTAQVEWALRTGAAALQSQLYIHFNSMMVSVYEERYNYDWNLFVSDLGGSVECTAILDSLLSLDCISMSVYVDTASIWYLAVSASKLNNSNERETSENCGAFLCKICVIISQIIKTNNSETMRDLYRSVIECVSNMSEERCDLCKAVEGDWMREIQGFLLGLSVIGLMKIFGKVWSTIAKPFFKSKKTKRDDISVNSSTVTAQLDSQNLVKNDLNIKGLANQDLIKNDLEFFKKCNEWNMKNNLRDIL